ncbi:MAG: hypothetical protein HRU20_11870 [Pseudomonadales bacterium]|nr:hypothetical protein [Pseudomonadales bacterium]
MEKDFWLQRWSNNEIGFHLKKANPLLIKHFQALNIEAGKRVFLPLCGKTRDIAWLLAAGYQVIGAELSNTAIQQLFKELELKPQITTQESFIHYSADNIETRIQLTSATLC